MCGGLSANRFTTLRRTTGSAFSCTAAASGPSVTTQLQNGLPLLPSTMPAPSRTFLRARRAVLPRRPGRPGRGQEADGYIFAWAGREPRCVRRTWRGLCSPSECRAGRWKRPAAETENCFAHNRSMFGDRLSSCLIEWWHLRRYVAYSIRYPGGGNTRGVVVNSCLGGHLAPPFYRTRTPPRAPYPLSTIPTIHPADVPHYNTAILLF